MSQPHPDQSDSLFFVTTNIKNRKKLFDNPTYAREAIDALYRVQEQHPFFLHGFVIMPDHCHLLLFVDEHQSISTIIGCYKMAVSFGIGIGPIWQSRFHMRLPENAAAMLHYIHSNPVKAGLVECAEDYLWSSGSGKWDITDVNSL
ncbi:MAG: transposase [bacterium]|nr:transposase [bacterium]MDA1292544.1 transposase [bacterium]